MQIFEWDSEGSNSLRWKFEVSNSKITSLGWKMRLFWVIFAHCEVSRRSRLRITFSCISGTHSNTVVYKYCFDTVVEVLFSSLVLLLVLGSKTWSVPQPTLLVSTWVLTLHTHGFNGLLTWFTWLPFSTSSIRKNQIKWLKSPLDGVFKGF